jgi:hypothetical protein
MPFLFVEMFTKASSPSAFRPSPRMSLTRSAGLIAPRGEGVFEAVGVATNAEG